MGGSISPSSYPNILVVYGSNDDWVRIICISVRRRQKEGVSVKKVKRAVGSQLLHKKAWIAVALDLSDCSEQQQQLTHFQGPALAYLVFPHEC